MSATNGGVPPDAKPFLDGIAKAYQNVIGEPLPPEILEPFTNGEAAAARAKARAEPTAPVMPGGESTSAMLRRVEQENDELRAEVDRLVRESAETVRYVQYIEGSRVPLIDSLTRHRDLLKAELASARTELEQLRYSGWIVARDGGRTCATCDQEIRRGEAYKVDVTGDLLRHVFCPDGERNND